MEIFAEPGRSFVQFGGECPAGWVQMATARPSLEHVATATGEWVTLPIIPKSVSRWQGREAMLLTPYGAAGDGMSIFDAVVALMSNAETPAYYVRAWEELQDFERDSPTLVAIADELGLTSEDLDSLFLLAASLRA